MAKKNGRASQPLAKRLKQGRVICTNITPDNQTNGLPNNVSLRLVGVGLLRGMLCLVTPLMHRYSSSAH